MNRRSAWLLLCLMPLAAPAAESVNVSVPEHQQVRLSNGLQLILIPRRDLPLIAFNAVLRGGARLDPTNKSGVAMLTADLLRHGAGDRDAFAFADAVEGVGGHLDADVRNESLVVRGQFLSRDSTLMLSLLADVLQRPHLDAAELQKLQARHIEAIRASKDSQPQALIGNYGRALLFGSHPYARPVGGSESSLARITRDDVLRYYRDYFGADRLILAIAGDFDATEMRRAVERSFGRWKMAAQPLPPLAEPLRPTGRRVLLVDAPGASQTYFWLGNVGINRSYTARAALDIANTAFGGSFSSMLNTELRTRTGLTYGASSRFSRGEVAGEVMLSSFTRTADTGRALELAFATLQKLRNEHLDDEVINATRRYMLGQYPLTYETSGEWAAALADLALYQLPVSHIGEYGSALLKADRRSVTRVIDSDFPKPANLYIVLIGDAARIRDVARSLGPVVEKPLAAPDFNPR